MITWDDTIIRLVLAAVFGGLVGMERQRYDWAAGLRTHMLVCLGSALIMIVSIFGFGDILGTPNVTLDPSRIGAQVISGIGFLGAGTIIFLKREVIKGLTTAAGLWTVAGVGLAVGSGLYLAAGATTALVLIILALVKPYKKRFSRADKHQQIELVVDRRYGSLQEIENIYKEHEMNLSQIAFRQTDDPATAIIEVNFINTEKAVSLMSIVESFKDLKGVKEVKVDF